MSFRDAKEWFDKRDRRVRRLMNERLGITQSGGGPSLKDALLEAAEGGATDEELLEIKAQWQPNP